MERPERATLQEPGFHAPRQSEFLNPPSRTVSQLVPKTWARPGTAANPARPMTSNKGAGYSTHRLSTAAGRPGAAPPSPRAAHQHCLALEERVHARLEESAELAAAGDAAGALDAAKDAARREQRLCAAREAAGQADLISLDLKYAASLNLAAAYHASGQLRDALSTYGHILRSRLFPQAGWLRLNMGNVCLQRGDGAAALRMYRLALDALPPALRRLRTGAARNVGMALAREGRYREAAAAFSGALREGPDHQTAFNLTVCACALRDRELMRQAFMHLLQVPPHLDADDDSDGSRASDDGGGSRASDDGGGGEGGWCPRPEAGDALHGELRARQAEAEELMLTAARAIAPLLDPGAWAAGFRWCCEQLAGAGLGGVAGELQLAWANEHLARGEYPAAVAMLKGFEQADSRLRGRAALTLSALHLAEGEGEAAAAYAAYCAEADPASAAARVNLGNVRLAGGDAAAALGLYQAAMQLDAGCLPARYNAGLAARQLGDEAGAAAAFEAVLAAAPGHAEAMWQLADLADRAGAGAAAVEWFTRLLGRAPLDAGSLARLGALHARLGEGGEAVQHYRDAHAACPSDLAALSWLGAHSVRQQDFAGARRYFEAAARAEPGDPKWALMAAGCLRRLGAAEEAVQRYRAIHAAHPANAECLRYLLQLSQDLGLAEDARRYAAEAQRAERLGAAISRVAAAVAAPEG